MIELYTSATLDRED